MADQVQNLVAVNFYKVGVVFCPAEALFVAARRRPCITKLLARRPVVETYGNRAGFAILCFVGGDFQYSLMACADYKSAASLRGIANPARLVLQILRGWLKTLFPKIYR